MLSDHMNHLLRQLNRRFAACDRKRLLPPHVLQYASAPCLFRRVGPLGPVSMSLLACLTWEFWLGQ